jgi:eukaryotic-like serine/threonine-protein kinase
LAATREQFLEALSRCGILSPDDWQALVGGLPSGAPVATDELDAGQLALHLVRAGSLTAFQAAALCQGRGERLLLGDYVLIDKIGAGGMGQVFKAIHRRMGRTAAVKVLPEQFTAAPQAVERFRREAKAATRLSHPNIVTAYDSGEHNGVHYLAMEYVAGTDLASHVRRNGPLSIGQAIHCIEQAAHGLHYAHKQGVVHRDIKPGNLLLRTDGAIKVLDMGLARIVSRGEGPDATHWTELTQLGEIMGTVDYMAPEQAVNASLADARADIYSLGCTLHYLLIGEPPYTGDSVMNRLLAHRQRPVPSLCERRAEVPSALDAVFQRMAAKSSDERYATMLELVGSLHAVEAELGGPAEALRPSAEGEVADEALLAWFRATDEAQQETHGAFGPTLQPVEPRRPARRGAFHGARDGARRKLLLAGAVCTAVALLTAALVMSRARDGVALVLVNEPGAQITIDDEPQATGENTAPSDGRVSFALPPGEHRVGVQKVGFEPAEATIQIVADKTRVVRFTLIPSDIDVRIARQVLRKRGTVTIDINGQSRTIASSADLPPDGFALTGISLYARSSASDADLELASNLRELRILDVSVTPIGDWGLRQVSGLRDLEELNLYGSAVTDEGMPMILGFKRLRSLNLRGTRVTDAGLTSLSTLRDLKYLDLASTALTDAGLVEIERCGGLAGLWLGGTQVSDEGLARIAGLTALQRLDVSGTGITDSGFRRLEQLHDVIQLDAGGTRLGDSAASLLAGMPHLEHLRLAGTWITDGGLANVRDLTALRSLDLAGTEVTDVGLAHLGRLVNLARLDLSHTRVTDDGLARLRGLISLRQLDLRHTVTTRAAVAGMQEALPDCQVTWLEEDIERRAAEWVILMGGSLRYSIPNAQPYARTSEELPRIPFQITEINLSNKHVVDANLSRLRGLVSLFVIGLDNTDVTDAALDEIVVHRRLSALHLANTAVSLHGVDKLKALPELAILTLPETDDAGMLKLLEVCKTDGLDVRGHPITDDGLASLKGAKLGWLYIGGTKITAAGLRHLAEMPLLGALILDGIATDESLVHLQGLRELHYLGLNGCAITDNGIERLTGLTKLRYLGLSGSRISDEGLRRLRALPELNDLNLANTAVSDAGVVELKQISTLEILSLEGTRVTPAGLAELRGALPQCRISP